MTTNAAIAKQAEANPPVMTLVANADLRIVEVGADKKLLAKFIRFPRELYPKESAWIAPLDLERKMAFDRKKNPFFEHADAAFFLCMQKDSAGKERIVGRISAQVDHEHTRIHNDGAGFYGNFDAIDDPKVAAVLFATAERWLKA